MAPDAESPQQTAPEAPTDPQDPGAPPPMMIDEPNGGALPPDSPPLPSAASDDEEAAAELAAEAGPAEAPNHFLEAAHGRGRVWSEDEHRIVGGAAQDFHDLHQRMSGLARKTGVTYHLEAALKALQIAYDGLLGHLVATSTTPQEKPPEEAA